MSAISRYQPLIIFDIDQLSDQSSKSEIKKGIFCVWTPRILLSLATTIMYIISYILMNQNIHCIGKKVMSNIKIFPNFCLICGLIWTFNAQYSCFMGHLGHELQFKIANSSPKSGSIPYFLYKKIHTYLTFILLSWYFSTFENKNDYLYKVCEFSF